MATVDEITNLDDFQIDELTREEIFNYLQAVGVDKDSKLNTEEARKKLKKRCEALRAGQQQQQQQGDGDGYSHPGGVNNFSTTDEYITNPPPGDFGTLMSYVLDQQKNPDGTTTKRIRRVDRVIRVSILRRWWCQWLMA